MPTSKNALRLSCALGLVALSVALLQGGCGDTAVSVICDKVCNCMECTDEYRNSCKDEGGIAQAKAGSLGCTTQFEAHTTCLEEKLGCKSPITRGDACVSQADALNQCTKDAVPLVAACRLAIGHLVACGIGLLTTKDAVEPLCTGVFLCRATCINTATCEEIMDGLVGTPTGVGLNFHACTTKCQNGG